MYTMEWKHYKQLQIKCSYHVPHICRNDDGGVGSMIVIIKIRAGARECIHRLITECTVAQL